MVLRGMRPCAPLSWMWRHVLLWTVRTMWNNAGRAQRITRPPLLGSLRMRKFLDLAEGGCEECYHLCCLSDSSDCAREIVTNSCCRKDKCWHCSWWRLSSPIGARNLGHCCNYAIRICRTCPVPSNAVLQIQGFPPWSWPHDCFALCGIARWQSCGAKRDARCAEARVLW